MKQLIVYTLFLLSLRLTATPPSPIVTPSTKNMVGRYSISGYIKDAENGETVIGATVQVKELKAGTASNEYGFYSLGLLPGKYTLVFSFVGYVSVEQVFDLKQNTTFNVELKPDNHKLSEVVVTGERVDANVTKNEMGVVKLNIEDIQKAPALFGEVDVMKVIQMLPGVVPTAEGTSGFSVRGGNIDGNLILLDEATVYNASHLMGFFSVFNNDAIRDIKLYKGDIPAMYGGRLSSVVDVRMKDGNSKKWSGTGGIGLISSRLTVEGPLSEKTSILLAGRRTYADLFFPFSSDSGLKKSRMYFYDLNLKLNHTINQNNRIFLSGYMGRDRFGQKGLTDAGFGNKTATLRWNHLYSDQLFSNLTAVASSYDYNLEMSQNGTSYVWNSSMQDYSLKLDFNYFLNPENNVRFGAATTYHTMMPVEAYIKSETNNMELMFPKNYALEHALYISNDQQVGENLSLKYGLRFSAFQNIGAATLYKYSNYNVTDTVKYSTNKIFNTYYSFEPRLGATYILDSHSSVKASYAHTAQYMQLASNSTGGMPLDVWFPASPNIKPQKCDQYSTGYFRNFRNNTIETSVEVFYKNMSNVIDFKDHAQLMMNPLIEGEVRVGKARAYGSEFLIRKNNGKLTGWISYTYSRVFRTVTEINNGNEYVSPYDKPHTINTVVSYDFTPRISMGANWVFASGSPFTAPVASFEYGNALNKIYSERNGERMRNYHRLDLSLTVKGKTKPNQLWQGEWVFSVYNVYGRHNDWMINFTQNDKINQIEATRWYLPFLFLPGITYNFKF